MKWYLSVMDFAQKKIIWAPSSDERKIVKMLFIFFTYGHSNETTKPRLGTLASSLITDFSARHEINMNPNSFILREC